MTSVSVAVPGGGCSRTRSGGMSPSWWRRSETVTAVSIEGMILLFLVRPLHCCAAVQREGTKPRSALYPLGRSGSCEAVHTSGALCPFVRLVPGACGAISGDRLCPDPVWKSASIPPLPRPLRCASPYYCGDDHGPTQAETGPLQDHTPAAVGGRQPPCRR